MADKILIARETIACTATKHGLIATFLPKPFVEEIGSGAHTHVSLASFKASPSPEVDTSEFFQKQFLAGLIPLLIFCQTGLYGPSSHFEQSMMRHHNYIDRQQTLSYLYCTWVLMCPCVPANLLYLP